MAASPTPTSAPGADPRRWQVLTVLGIAQFMLILDVTVVAVALPLMGAELDLSREVVTWVVSAYTLTFGGLILLGGRLADLLGPRPLVLTGLLLFSIASLVTGAAESGTAVLVGRVGQGVGAALLSPAALSVVVRLFEGDERNRALGIWSALGGGGAAVGVLVGGLLTAGPGWPWVFFVNVPVGLVALVVLLRVLPPLPAFGAGGRRQADLLGAGLVTAATGTAIYAMIGAGDEGWLAARTLALFGASLVLYLLFGLRQRMAAAPLMDLELLFRRPVSAGAFVIAIATALMVAIFFLGTFFLQQHEDHGPLATGLLFLPVAVTTMAGAQLGGRLIGRLGGRRLAAGSLVVSSAGLAIAAASATTLGVVGGVSAGAFGIGALFVVASATALGQVAPAEAGIASGVVSTFHEFGASAGAAVASSVAAGSLAAGTEAGYADAFVVSSVVALIAAVVAVAVIPPRPSSSPTSAPGVVPAGDEGRS